MREDEYKIGNNIEKRVVRIDKNVYLRIFCLDLKSNDLKMLCYVYYLIEIYLRGYDLPTKILNIIHNYFLIIYKFIYLVYNILYDIL